MRVAILYRPACKKRRNRVRRVIDALERRTLLSLDLAGTQQDDVITIAVTGSAVVFTLNGDTINFGKPGDRIVNIVGHAGMISSG